MEFIFDKKSERLDKFLAEKVRGLSRSQWEKAIKNGAVKINGRFALKRSSKLKKGDIVSVREERLIFPKKEIEVEPQNIPLKIIYEDKDILVIDKPAGLLVHPTHKEHRNTLANALIHRWPEIKGVGENNLRPGIVHRLDKETSGLLIAAKNQKAFLHLKKQFLNRTIVKKYLALVERVSKEKEGIIEYAIKPSKKFRLKKVAVKRQEGEVKKSIRAAKTYYKVIKTFDDKFALLELEPKTGRTHQIRVHLASIGHPIVGDALYGAKAKILKGKRHFLHAYYLKFILPSGSPEARFAKGDAPMALEIDLPDDLKKVIKGLVNSDKYK